MSHGIGISSLQVLRDALDSLGSRVGRDIALRQLHILCAVVAAGEDGIDASKLSRMTDTSSSAISRNVRILGDVHYDKQSPGLGLVSVQLDPMDNRRRVVKATKEGVEVVRALLSAVYRDRKPV